MSQSLGNQSITCWIYKCVFMISQSVVHRLCWLLTSYQAKRYTLAHKVSLSKCTCLRYSHILHRDNQRRTQHEMYQICFGKSSFMKWFNCRNYGGEGALMYICVLINRVWHTVFFLLINKFTCVYSNKPWRFDASVVKNAPILGMLTK